MARLLRPDGVTEIELKPNTNLKTFVMENIKDYPIEGIHVFLNGRELILETYIIQGNENFVFAAIPMGGGGSNEKQILGAIAIIAIAIAAPYAVAAMGYMGATAAAISAGITIVGSLAVTAMIPPPKLDVGKEIAARNDGASSAFFFSSQSNSLKPFGVVPRLYGIHKIFPALAAQPLITTIGEMSQIAAVYDFGLGDVFLFRDSFKVGESDLMQFDPEIEVHQNSLVKNTRFVNKRVNYQQFSYKLLQDSPFIVSSVPQTTGMSLEITFPRGLVSYASNGSTQAEDVALRVEYKAKTETEWKTIAIPEGKGFSTIGTVADSSKSQAISLGVRRLNTVYNFTFNLRTGQIVAGWPGFYGISSPSSFAVPYPDPETHYNLSFAPTKVNINLGFGPMAIPVQISVIEQPNITNNFVAKLSFPNLKLGEGYGSSIPINTTATLATSKVTGTAIRGSSATPFVVLYRTPEMLESEIEMRITRLTPLSTVTTKLNDAVLTLARSYQSASPFELVKPHTMVEMKINASEKISGVIDNFSAVGISILRTTKDGITFENEPTSNPAWIVLDILTGEANSKPLKDSQIDWPSFIKFAAKCDETWTPKGSTNSIARYSCNIVVDFKTTVSELVQSILSGARATMTISQNGLYGIVIDEERLNPRQLITTSNSISLVGNKNFPTLPHGMRVNYINPENNYKRDTLEIYAPNFDKDSAIEFEEISTFGITDYYQAAAWGRYMLKQALLRQETLSVEMDIENLVLQRGDLVAVQNDYSAMGGEVARVQRFSNGEIYLDREILSNFDALIHRDKSGKNTKIRITKSSFTGPQSLKILREFEVDDLLIFNNFETETSEYLVQAIEPSEDLRAVVKLAPYVKEVYEDDYQEPQVIADENFDKSVMKIINEVAYYTLSWEGVEPFGEVALRWDESSGLANKFDVFIVENNVKRFLGTVAEKVFYFKIDLLTQPSLVGHLTFEILPLTFDDRMGISQRISVDTYADKSAPEAPKNPRFSVENYVINLIWDEPRDPNAAFTEIYFSTEDKDTLPDSAQFVGSIPYGDLSYQTMGQIGTYYFIHKSYFDKVSAVAKVQTTEDDFKGFHIYKVLDETKLEGQISGDLVRNGNALELKTPESIGYYYFKERLDLERIYDIYFSYSLNSSGKGTDDYLNDYWANITPSDSIYADPNHWRSTLQVRTALIDNGPETFWSNWQYITGQKFQGKFFEFRASLESFNPQVTASFSDLKIIAGSPDRVETGTAETPPDFPVSIKYRGGFLADPLLKLEIIPPIKPPNVTDADWIAQQAAAPVLKVVVMKSTIDGFTAVVVNDAGRAVAGKFKWTAEGYGLGYY